jgi:hypothetical protein
MLRTAKTYIFEEMGVEMPKGNIPGSWFAENALPMIVECTCCGTTMALPSAMIDDDGTIYCPSCAGGMEESAWEEEIAENFRKDAEKDRLAEIYARVGELKAELNVLYDEAFEIESAILMGK